VARLLVGTQLEDTVFATNATGTLWITDSAQNAIFIVKSQLFTSGAIWTEAPNDSGVASWVGTLDPTTGIVTPQIVGFGSPTGLLFVPGP
ncbi:MAG TPA: hypothetical protein VKG44_02935, partial [Candidatus Baltobacteraceae bacterium]|nr:hypothetical protein [Candidatus Baltobacteraceae bacterium]